MQPCGLQNPVEAADILAAHGDHWGALTLLEDRLRSPTHPDEPAAWALKPAEAQRLHTLWMKLGTPETCTSWPSDPRRERQAPKSSGQSVPVFGCCSDYPSHLHSLKPAASIRELWGGRRPKAKSLQGLPRDLGACWILCTPR